MWPHDVRCTGRYKRGVVTRILSDQAVEVDGFPRHVRELRHQSPSSDSRGKSAVSETESDEQHIHLPMQDLAAEGDVESDDGDAADREEHDDEAVANPIELRRSLRQRRPPREYTCYD